VTHAYGPVDLLVNNAAVMYLAPMADAELDDWLEMVDVNLKAPLALMAAVLPSMLARRSGQIVNLSSISARRPGPGVQVYGATKAALDVLSEGLRQELAPRGVRVTSFQLGAVDTALNDKIRNAPMRRLIQARAKGYRALPVDEVVREVLHAVTLPPHINLGQVFLVPTDQAG
jgi:NADP-dependent 3-hydroxy acid dehydrogenase YdfG